MGNEFVLIDKSGSIYSRLGIGFDYIESISDELILIKKGGKYGFIDTRGKIIIEPQFAYAKSFSCGFALVEKPKGVYHYIDKVGNIRITPKCVCADSFSENLACIRVHDTTDTYGDDYDHIEFINLKGKTEIKLPYSSPSAESFSDGLALLKKSNRCDYINKSAEIILTTQYDAESFSEGLARIRMMVSNIHHWKFGYINKKGDIVIEPINCKYSGSFSEHMSWIAIENENGCERFGYINIKGEIIIEPKYTGAGNFSDGLAPIEINDKYGYIDSTGKIIIETKYKYANEFNNGLAVVELY